MGAAAELMALARIQPAMRDFAVLFDDAEPSTLEHPAYARYGGLGFPSSPHDRPWIFANFVQSLDGIVSFKGRHAAGSDISQSAEDRWLMDLLRVHADAVILGVNTLIDETAQRGDRGPVFRIQDRELRDLRARLGRGGERNIFVTGSATLDLGRFRVFDGDSVQPMVLTTATGAARLAEKRTHPHVRILVAGEGKFIDLPAAMRELRRQGIAHLLCEGGPTFYGYLDRAGLVDEKFLTISPLEVGQQIPSEQEPSDTEQASPPRERPTTIAAPGFTKENAPWWYWLSCRRVGDHQFSRYRRKRS